MKTLYISDLDGTLLNENVELSDYTINTLNTLIKNGVHFTIATARTAASVVKIMEPVSIQIPIILMNGVLIYDIPSKKYLKIERLTKDTIFSITSVLKDNHLNGFMYEVKDDVLATYYQSLNTKALKDFHDERVNKYQKKFIQVSDFNLVDPTHIIYFALMDTKEKLESAYNQLSKISDISLAFYKDIYTEDDVWFLEIFSVNATKYNAAMYLKSYYNYEKVIGFGDNLNDLPLFKACDETYAVKNAKEEVKKQATSIINSNLDNGVASWLERNAL
jgi:5-amino-6-(5-phospho-D-ribitylamino)uracil phosphatase